MARPTYEQLEEQLKVAKEKLGAAEKKAEAAETAAVEEAAALEGHIKAAYWALKTNDGLPVLPKATLRVIVKDDPDAAAILVEQMENFSRRTYGSISETFREYDGCLALLAELPMNGANLAFKKMVDLAVRRLEDRKRYPRQSSDRHLPNYDYVTLAAVCIKASENRLGEMNEPYDPRSDIDSIMQPIKLLPPIVRSLVLHERSKILQTTKLSVGRSEASDGVVTKREAKEFVKKVWFPVTLKFLHELLRKEIAEILVPLIAGDVLPVELMDMIYAFCYDADFIAQAPAIAKKKNSRVGR